MVEYERLIPEYDRAVVCSPIDRQFLLQHIPEARIDLVPNGIDLDFFSIEGDLQPDPYRIVFAGNMSYFPNTDGAVFLIEEIFPHIKKSVPEAKIYIVGQNPPRRIKALAREDVVVTGFVSDIRSAYLRGSVAVSPIRFGAGTPNKVLEPLALGIPVVSTAIGVEGLDLQAGKEIFIASSPEEFAGHVIRLLTDSELRKEVGRAARSAVMKQYDIKTTAQELERIYIQISQQT
jgi:glycosyltransferase involved in cell wall biosynthesis